jgi:hypothetical protein
MAQAKRKDRKPEAAPRVEEAVPPNGWQKPKGLSRRGWLVLAGAVLLINLPVIHHFLRSPPEAPLSLPWSDTFDSDATISEHYFTTGGLWRVRDGRLLSPGVKNNPLWLKAKLPHNVRVEFDATAGSPEGDIRVEIFGDGVDHNSGYEIIQGGWNNSVGAIVRLEETGKTMQQLREDARQQGKDDLVASGVFGRRTSAKVERPFPARQGQTYHWVIERRGSVLRWSIDGQPVLELNDPFPLYGSWNDRVGLSSFEGDVYFDNLRVEALDDQPFTPGSGPSQLKLGATPHPYADDFDRETLGGNWNATDPSAVRIDNGSVLIQNAHNHPVWLTQAIPENATIDVDAWTDSAEGDLKLEIWGDGHSFFDGPNIHAAYDSTGYVFILGGWHNPESVIARMQEHGNDRVGRADFHVETGKHYHWHIVRKGEQIRWEIDGQPFLQLNDPHPLTGEGHRYLAIGDWESPVHFDNLKIQPL